MTKKVYHHLQYEDRVKIKVLIEKDVSQSEIASLLSFDRSTISREIGRNKGKRGYKYKQAQRKADNRKNKANGKKKKLCGKTLEVVVEKIVYFQWSPEQIAGWMKRNMKISVSHETIYQYIWKDKKNGGTLYKHLRHNGKKYNKRKGKNAGRGLIPNRIDIDDRPKIVEEKVRIGDWEIDTVIGKNHKGALVSMVDRASKYTKIMLVKNKKASVVTDAINKSLKPFDDVVHTLTADNGKEFAFHEKITSSLNANVYFAKPYHSWERGLNEHTNGLIRQYFPKKTSFDTITQSQVQKVEYLLNSRPRKILKFKTPLEVFNQARFDLSFVALRT